MTTDVEISGVTRRAPNHGIVRRCLTGIRLYLNKRRERLALSLLSDDELLDIGLTPSEAKTEVGKSWFWG